MNWPGLPQSVEGLAGPIRVDRPLKVEASDAETRGLWLTLERRILVQSTLRRDTAWMIFFHEFAHSCLDDAGVRLTDDQGESVCDAMSSGMLRLMRSHLQVAQTPPQYPSPAPTARSAK